MGLGVRESGFRVQGSGIAIGLWKQAVICLLSPGPCSLRPKGPRKKS